MKLCFHNLDRLIGSAREYVWKTVYILVAQRSSEQEALQFIKVSTKQQILGRSFALPGDFRPVSSLVSWFHCIPT
jgi:hypothetical protein